MGAIKADGAAAGGGLRLRYAAFMQGLRDAIDARIRTRWKATSARSPPRC